jgi:hypothetical protein
MATPQIEQYANSANTTLNGAINNSVTSITVTSATGFPSTGQYRILVDGEIMLVTGGQGTTTWTVATRGSIENSAAASHLDLAPVRFIVTAGSLINLRSRDAIITPISANPYGLDDDFGDSILDSSWVQVDGNSTSSHVTWTEGADQLSVLHNANCTATNIHAKVKALGSTSLPLTIQIGVRYFTPYAYNYLMIGPVFADGTTAGAGKQMLHMDYTNSNLATAVNLSTRSFINYTTETTPVVDVGSYQWMGPVLHQRLIWASANTFHSEVSPDGLSWHRYATSMSYTMTPTHAGPAINLYTNPAGQKVVIATIEYFRVF